MHKEKLLTLTEKKELYLEMMDEIDSFCRFNGIRYSLTCGTLIGAIRHQGFIPWDDDLDIMMPYPDMMRFKEIFKSPNLKYVDIDVNPDYQYGFSRIESLKTYSFLWPFQRSSGVSIDLYPVLGLPKRYIEIDKFLFGARKVLKKRLKYNRWQNRISRYCPITMRSIATHANLEYRDFMFQFPYGETNHYYHLGGVPNWAAVFDRDYFDKIIDVPFEGRLYRSVAEYDILLTNSYGDYMKLPPVEERRSYHGGYFYWKE